MTQSRKRLVFSTENVIWVNFRDVQGRAIFRQVRAGGGGVQSQIRSRRVRDPYPK